MGKDASLPTASATGAWLSALRLRTLPLAISSILVGSALAAHEGIDRAYVSFRPAVLVLALITAVLLQILSNLANDLGDHLHGTDNAARVGPQRSVQSGAIAPETMKRAMILCGMLALVAGIVLIIVALGIRWTTLAFLLLGLSAIAAAVKYTYGKEPYGYAGRGDISVFVFFGLIGVMGTYFLHARHISVATVLPAIGFGLLSTGVLNTNNMRDIRNDTASGKRTMAVELGSARAKSYHGLLIIGGLLALIAYTATHFRGMPQWGFLITAPVLATHLKQVLGNHDPALLDPELKRLALGTFFTAIVFSIGLILT